MNTEKIVLLLYVHPYSAEKNKSYSKIDWGLEPNENTDFSRKGKLASGAG